MNTISPTASRRMVENGVQSNEWLLGRVEMVYAGTDHKVRTVDVKAHRGIISRPGVKLVVLPQEN